VTDYTDITVLLDRSGSMVSIKAQMEAGYASFIETHQAVPSTRVTLIQFDGEHPQQVLYENHPIVGVPPLVIRPRGSTPLCDALCDAIDGAGVRLARTPEAERPARVLFVIITDGQENSSQRRKRHDVKTRIDHQRGAYDWQFVYLGANQDAFREAESFGIDRGHAVNYAASGFAPQNVMKGMAVNTVAYAQGRSLSVPDFSDEQRAEAMNADEETPPLP
jgi:hypothetical protein